MPEPSPKRSLADALAEGDWRERFRIVAEWLDAVDDYDRSILAEAADELRRRADG